MLVLRAFPVARLGLLAAPGSEGVALDACLFALLSEGNDGTGETAQFSCQQ